MKLEAAAILLMLGAMSRVLGLGYIESSNGLVPPTLEGGNTELEFADINSDGKIDIISIGDHGNPYINTDEHGVMVWFGDGQGNWRCTQTGDFGYGGIAVGDVNNDGYWDIGYGMHHDYSHTDFGDSMVEVALGDGTGVNWTPWDDGLGPPAGTWGMFCTDFGDLNLDGYLDMVASTFGYGAGFRAYINNCDGTWYQSFRSDSGNDGASLALGDVNGDGRLDLAIAHGAGTVWFGDGSGGFVLAQRNLPPPRDMGCSDVALGDVDGDGMKDLGFVTNNGSVQVWGWSPEGDSWRLLALPAGGCEAVELCDMDSDGAMDIATFGNHNLMVWCRDSIGIWRQAAACTTGLPGLSCAFRCGGDVDHNGRPDIVLVSEEGRWPSERNVMHCFKETTAARELRIIPAFPRGRERLLGGSVQFVDWCSEVPGGESACVRLELSITGPSGPWEAFANDQPNSGRYQWRVPQGITSGNCHIRYTITTPSGTAWAITPRSFAIGDTSAGILAGRSPKPRAEALAASVVSGVLYLPGETTSGRPGWLLDIAGRRVAQLSPGPNGVSKLAPGVYFVTQQRQAQRQQIGLGKVVITR